MERDHLGVDEFVLSECDLDISKGEKLRYRESPLSSFEYLLLSVLELCHLMNVNVEYLKQ